MRQRLRADFVVLFVVLNVASVAKLVIHPTPTRSLSEVLARLGMGLLPWAAMLVVGLGATALRPLRTTGHPRPDPGDPSGEPPPLHGVPGSGRVSRLCGARSSARSACRGPPLPLFPFPEEPH